MRTIYALSLSLTIVLNIMIVVLNGYVWVESKDKENGVLNVFNSHNHTNLRNTSKIHVNEANILFNDTLAVKPSKRDPPVNHAPMVENITLSRDPNVVLLPILSNNSMYVDYDYYDQDGDKEKGTEIHWYCNNGTGWALFLTSNKKLEINESDLIKGHQWYASIRPKDGKDFGELKSSSIITVDNSPPSVVKAWISPNIPDTNYTPTDEENPNFNTTSTLNLYWIDYDADGDSIVETNIIWEYSEDGEIYYEVPTLENLTQVPSFYTTKFQNWRAQIRIFDGEEWSLSKTTKRAKIGNSLPVVLDLDFIDHNYASFLVDDEEIKIAYSFFDADGDNNLSDVHWFKDGICLPDFNGRTTIHANETHPGEVWYFEVRPFDGYNYGHSVTSQNMTIESRPTILNFGYTPLPDYEGHYQIWIEINDLRNPVTEVNFSLLSESILADWNGTYYTRDYYFDLSYLNSTLLVTSTITSIVETYNEKITTFGILNIPIEDYAPPRVHKVVPFWDEANPNQLIFYAEIEEFGSEIEEVVIYYQFLPIEDKNTNKFTTTRISSHKLLSNRPHLITLLQDNESDIEWKTSDMNSVNSTHWEVIVDYNPGLKVDILVKLFVVDSSGNFNDNAYPRTLNLPESLQFPQNTTVTKIDQKTVRMILLIIAIAFVFLLSFSAIAVRKWQNVEFIGLDKESVINNIAKISEIKAMNSVDLRTLGIVVSYFDQKLGP
ncbi:MAG: hypothetical protein ACFFDT_25740, partial [Candidatus Hodarchaeota archaeon]